MQYLRPVLSGFAGISFRPQLWIQGAQNFLHNNNLDSELLREDEADRPSVLTMHSFGGTNVAEGAFAHVRTPQNSRARGGTGDGGAMFTPPEFEPEDYFGINSIVDVETPETDNVVLFTPGVSLAFGTPTVAGGVNIKGVIVDQDFTDNLNPLRIRQFNSSGVLVDLISASITQDAAADPTVVFPGGAAIVLPSGNDAARPGTPVAGSIRVSTQASADVVEFFETQEAQWTALETVIAANGKFALIAGQAFTGDCSWTDNEGTLYGTGLDASIKYDGTNLIIKPDVVGSGVVQIDGHLKFDDNDEVRFGTGNDSRITFNGTDLLIDPDLDATGIARFSSSINVTTGDEYRHDDVAGISVSRVFVVVNGDTHTVTVSGGIITGWLVTPEE